MEPVNCPIENLWFRRANNVSPLNAARNSCYSFIRDSYHIFHVHHKTSKLNAMTDFWQYSHPNFITISILHKMLLMNVKFHISMRIYWRVTTGSSVLLYDFFFFHNGNSTMKLKSYIFCKLNTNIFSINKEMRLCVELPSMLHRKFSNIVFFQSK